MSRGSGLLIRAFTDGSCKNSGIGGWGWIAYMARMNWKKYIQWSDWGGSDVTTNQEMELRALAQFLNFCPRRSKVEVWSDSKYVLGGIVGNISVQPGAIYSDLFPLLSLPQGWIKGWVSENSKLGSPYSKNYWKKRDLANPFEWYKIHQLLMEHLNEGTKMDFGWVKGHSKIEGNELADELANLYHTLK